MTTAAEGRRPRSCPSSTWGTAEQQATWNKLFAKFGEKHPDIKLKAEGIPLSNWGDFFNKLSTRLAGGQVPDVIQVATEGQRLFASKGLLAPLDDYIAKDQGERSTSTTPTWTRT